MEHGSTAIKRMVSWDIDCSKTEIKQSVRQVCNNATNSCHQPSIIFGSFEPQLSSSPTRTLSL